MKFENQYLTYKEYQSLGGELNQTTFNIKEYKAEKVVDLYTFNRFRKVDDYPDELKACMFDLVELISEETTSSYSTEKVGNYSVSGSKSDIRQARGNIVQSYFSGVCVDEIPVLYRGADTNEN